MALEDARRRALSAFKPLKKAIGAGEVDLGGLWAAFRPDLLEWWDEYKKWERDDRFDAAFGAGRMTIRFSQASKQFNLNARIGQGGEKKDWTKPPKAGKGALAARMAAFQKPDPFVYKVGLDSLTERTEPTNFINRDGNSMKVDQGLHDLSASLLNPGRPISDQLFNQPQVGDLYAFMPLSEPADQAFFQELNECAKAARELLPDFYAKVREYRSQMTRVKLACEHDMGAGFTAMAPQNPVNPKFRYGIPKKTKVVDEAATAASTERFPGVTRKGVTFDHTIYQARRNAALNFLSILTERFKTNEIVVAYRQHNGPFPLFGRWDGTRFECFTLRGTEIRTTAETISDSGVLS